MVKGCTQRVVVIRARGSELFDEAIFLVRPGLEDRLAITDRMLLDEAKKAASAGFGTRWRERALFALSGGSLVGLVWLLSVLF